MRVAEHTASPVLAPEHLVRGSFAHTWERLLNLNWVMLIGIGFQTQDRTCIGWVLGKSSSAKRVHTWWGPWWRLWIIRTPRGSFSGCKAYLENLRETKNTEWKRTGWEGHTDVPEVVTKQCRIQTKTNSTLFFKKWKPKKIKTFFLLSFWDLNIL